MELKITSMIENKDKMEYRSPVNNSLSRGPVYAELQKQVIFMNVLRHTCISYFFIKCFGPYSQLPQPVSSMQGPQHRNSLRIFMKKKTLI